MKNLLIQACIILILVGRAFAQEEETTSTSSPLVFSGSADIYYKYDFAGMPNISTSFANDHNSFSLGMFNLIATKEIGKASFVADIGMGPRNASSVGPSEIELQPGIQNLYISYEFTDKLSMIAGYMGTFVGYEVISPTGNFNYSTSYLFTNGPFQNAGLKVKYAFSDMASLMVGIFDDWNVYQQTPGIELSTYGAQLTISPVEGWDAYFNFISGKSNGMELDLTTGYQITDQFYLGLNAATWKYALDASNDAKFSGAALYAQFAASDAVSIGLRGELFNTENTGYIGTGIISGVEAKGVTAFTLSANIGGGALKFIPEFRVDKASENVFMDGNLNETTTAMQFLGALVFSF
ncbi:MAG: porin [Cyclobacteriaceae bacterium]|nr:porin [Cyclobacteriaceae bacterium]